MRYCLCLGPNDFLPKSIKFNLLLSLLKVELGEINRKPTFLRRTFVRNVLAKYVVSYLQNISILLFVMKMFGKMTLFHHSHTPGDVVNTYQGMHTYLSYSCKINMQ